MTADDYDMIVSTILVVVVFGWAGMEFLFWLVHWALNPPRRPR